MSENQTAPTSAPAGFRTTEYECAKGWPEQYKGTKLTRDFATTVEGAVSAGHFASMDALLNAAYGQLKIKAGHAAQRAATESMTAEEGKTPTPLTIDEIQQIFRSTSIGAPRARGEGKPKGPNAGVVKEAKELKASIDSALAELSEKDLATLRRVKAYGPDTDRRVDAELARRKNAA